MESAISERTKTYERGTEVGKKHVSEERKEERRVRDEEEGEEEP
jgi:hypothetical protein